MSPHVYPKILCRFFLNRLTGQRVKAFEFRPPLLLGNGEAFEILRAPFFVRNTYTLKLLRTLKVKIQHVK